MSKTKIPTDVKFVHIRYDKVGNVIAGRDKRNVTAKGGITVAYSIKDDAVLAQIAICSLKDSYNKKIGAAISAARLKKSPDAIPLTHFRVEDGRVYDVTQTLVRLLA